MKNLREIRAKEKLNQEEMASVIQTRGDCGNQQPVDVISIRENLTVIVCAQLNRQSDPYGIPELSHIKDCGGIEQDSSRVITLTKDRFDINLTRFHLIKNRHGETGKTDLVFYGANMRFPPKT